MLTARTARGIALIPAIALLGHLGGFIGKTQSQTRRINVEEAIEAELLDRTRNFFWSGAYDDCAALCESGIGAGREYGFLIDLYFRALMAEGKEPLAYREFVEFRQRDAENLPLLMTGYRLARATGRQEEAVEILRQVNRLAGERSRMELSADDLVAVGEAAFELGADPEKVLKNYFRAAREKEKHYGLSYLAAGNLALEKRNFDVAAREFRAGIKAYPGDPDMHFGLAAAFFPSNRKLANELIDKALSINPKHTASLLLRAEHFIDAERYDEAGKVLREIHKVNRNHPGAWALAAVIAIFENDKKQVARARKNALKNWRANPEVDYRIGKSISRMRRFAEGAEYQRAALKMDPEHLPAKIQLAQDLLRLGKEEDAWELVEQVHRGDAYHVVAFNLATLRDEMKDYQTIATDDFVLRMTRKEAEVYGDRALEILEEAKSTLCPKYGITLDEPVLVEFFPSQHDFAVRTLGVPGGGGLLGVCFGSVITMNSPGGMAHGRNNWEATLWHEFCHVVTLGLTQNKMSRWLSEGISVYEELQRDPTWGQRMTPVYRQMILEGDVLKPVSEIGSMFLNPRSGAELMFAYYESALVVEYLVERYGIDRLQKLLAALGKGDSMEKALSAHMVKPNRLDAEFEEFAKDRARKLGPGVDWTEPEGLDLLNADTVQAFLEKHPNNLEALKIYVGLLLEEERWEEAVEWGEKLRWLFPRDLGEDSVYLALARAYRESGDLEKEKGILRDLADLSSEALPAYLRLMELDLNDRRWPELRENAVRALAVNPFLERPYYGLGRALEIGGDSEAATDAFEKVLRLGSEKPAEIHYRLARLKREKDPDEAKRHVLDSLSEAPRFREAQRLLVEMVGGPQSSVDGPESREEGRKQDGEE